MFVILLSLLCFWYVHWYLKLSIQFWSSDWEHLLFQMMLVNKKLWLIKFNKKFLSRFSTVKYEKGSNANLQNQWMHLTNYSINKTSTEYIRWEWARNVVGEWVFRPVARVFWRPVYRPKQVPKKFHEGKTCVSV